ncbi:UNVERIFIED_CONTAM: hypothetical protein Slati_3492600 [Sesamum latifolium]|uniref:Uncharacterized protein n=1 Tax=Sesamum latifolium TaxID=2727402 RepID=A0AAW2UHY8_9LAMI
MYWKDDVDLEYCKFCGDARYKPTRGQDPHRKKSPYDVLRRFCTARSVWWYLFTLARYHYTVQSPPGMCMSSEYMFLTMVIFGSSNLKRLIDVYLKPLIEELLQLWHVGVRTYDHATDNEFIMWAVLMWTVDDLPPMGWHLDGVPSGLWDVRNKKAFMKNHVKNKVAHPRLSGDQLLDWVAAINPAVELMSLSLPEGYSTDHKWMKKSIFWDLPY